MLFKVRIVVCFSILYLFALSGQARAQRRFEQAENGDSLADSDNEQLEESASQLGAEQDDSKAMEALNMQDQSVRHEGSGPSYVSGTLISKCSQSPYHICLNIEYMLYCAQLFCSQ